MIKEHIGRIIRILIFIVSAIVFFIIAFRTKAIKQVDEYSVALYRDESFKALSYDDVHEFNGHNNISDFEKHMEQKKLEGELAKRLEESKGSTDKNDVNVSVIKPTQVKTQKKVVSKPSSKPKKTKVKSKPKTKAKVKSENRWGITLTQNEIDLLAKIVWLESRGEGDKGQQAVVEVIFNRMKHNESCVRGSGTLTSVLSKKNQFSTWKNRNIAKPSDKEYKNIKMVLGGNTNILTNDHVFFSTGARNNRGVIKIGCHYFCKY